MRIDNTVLRGKASRPEEFMNTTFIGVPSADVLKLRSGCGKLNQNTSENKGAAIKELIRRIEAFKLTESI